MIETSWTTNEGDTRLAVVHDNRWLAIVGVPLATFGLAVAAVPWLIESARNSGAWPILAVGSLIGTGIVVMGMALCFHYVEIVADRRSGSVTRRDGLPPFQRAKSWPLGGIDEVVCVNETMAGGGARGSSTHYRLRLVGPSASVLVASALEPEPVRQEAARWARFLNRPLVDQTGSSRQERLRAGLESGREVR